MEELLTLVGGIVVGGLLIWLAFRLEPHWSARDGSRFTCRIQSLTHDLAAEGTWREMRGRVLDGRLVLSSRGLRGAGLSGTYEVIARSPAAPGRKAVFLVRRDGDQIALRVPASSPCVQTLDAIARQRT